jgi:hypothetical protein
LLLNTVGSFMATLHVSFLSYLMLLALVIHPIDGLPQKSHITLFLFFKSSKLFHFHPIPVRSVGLNSYLAEETIDWPLDDNGWVLGGVGVVAMTVCNIIILKINVVAE